MLCVFQYIELMKRTGVQRSTFDEVQSLASLAFRFKEKYPPSQYTSRLAGFMQHNYPPQYVLSGPSLIREFDPDIINRNLEYLRPDNFRIMVASQHPPNGVQFTKREKWYGTEYEVLDFSVKLSKASLSSLSQIFMEGLTLYYWLVPATFGVERCIASSGTQRLYSYQL